MKLIIRNSSILLDLKLLSELTLILGNMDKFKATLLYRESRDGLSPENLNPPTLLNKCLEHNVTITFLHTDLNTVIGCYSSVRWEDTTNKKSSDGSVGY